MRQDVVYWIALTRVPGIGPAAVKTLCRRCGSPENVFAAPRAELERVKSLRAESIDALARPRQVLVSAEKLAREMERAGIDVLTWDDDAYPRRLLDLRDAPPVLYALGRPPQPEDKTFSVAGSKDPSAKGAEIARLAGCEFAEAGWTVVSGYAPGVDSSAHLGALERGGTTVLCLPLGIRAFSLRREFAKFSSELGGRLVTLSECPPDEAWSAQNAVRRDRLIAALGMALLVVEAQVECGTMITFRHAKKLGRPTYVIKYKDKKMAPGNERAIKEGGIAVGSMSALRRVARAARLPQTVLKQSALF